MEKPTEQQLADAIIESARLGESEAQFDDRVADLHRLSDEELAEMGVVPIQQEGEVSEPLHFAPVPVKRRHDGWTAERQRTFIATLAETGCVSEACAEVGITPRSAYRLREHPKAVSFRAAWDHATSMASARLVALAFERAVHGSVERIYRNGELVEERRKPSDKLLMWLLSHRDPVGYGWLARPPSEAPHQSFYPVQHARREMPKHLRRLSDIDPADCPAERTLGTDLDPYDERLPA